MKITLAYILSLVAGFFMVTIHAQELNDQEVEAAFQQQLLFSDSVRQKNPESSYHHLQQAYDFAHTYDHDSLKVWSYTTLGHYHQRYTGYDSAIRYFERAVKLSEQLEDTYLRVESNRTLAMQEVDRGEIDKAMQRLQVALDLAIELPEKSKLDLQISMSMAYVLMDGGFYDKALDYLFEETHIPRKK